jgi:hypothetical protein
VSDITDLIADAVVARVIAKLPDVIPVERKLLTLDQTAEYLNCTPQWVMRLAAQGKLHPVYWSSGKRAKPYFDVEDLKAAIEDAKQRKGGAAA